MGRVPKYVRNVNPKDNPFGIKGRLISMNCIYLRIRSKKYNKYSYCIKNKKEITYQNCKNCKNKEYKVIKPIKQRTYKQAKMEKNRFSIITDDLTVCIECGKRKESLHEIFRGRNRQNSIRWGLVIPLCLKCHASLEIEEKWKTKGQKAFMEYYNKSTDDFIKIFFKNYL